MIKIILIPIKMIIINTKLIIIILIFIVIIIEMFKNGYIGIIKTTAKT
jgi:hypothetical protein